MEIISRPCSEGRLPPLSVGRGFTVKRRGDLFYPVRQEFHHEANPSKGASEPVLNAPRSHSVDEGSLFSGPQARWSASRSSS